MNKQYFCPAFAFGLSIALIIGATNLSRAATNIQAWTGESTFEGPRHSGSSTASGTATRTDEGVSWEAERQGTVDGDKKWQSTTTGSGSKTDTGYERSSTTKGSTESGKEWTTERDVEAVKNDDGTMTINRDAAKTFDDGTIIKRESQTVVTKTEDGKTWETTGTKTGPKGTATMSGSGSAVKIDDGVDVKINRKGTTAGSKTWESTTTGSGTKTGTGKKWNSTTAGSTEGGKTWKTTREDELQKSGGSANFKRKRTTEIQPATSGGQTKKSGFFSKFKRSAGK